MQRWRERFQRNFSWRDPVCLAKLAWSLVPVAAALLLLLYVLRTHGSPQAEEALRPLPTQGVKTARHEHFDLLFHMGETVGDCLRLEFTESPQKQSRLHWDANGLVIAHTRKGRLQVVARRSVPLPANLAGGRLRLRRKDDVLELIQDGHRHARFLLEDFASGDIAVGIGDGCLAVKDVEYQRLEPFVFGDDFMRTEEEAKDMGLWHPVSGQWKIYSVMEHVHDMGTANIRKGYEPASDRSPNPFCLSGDAAEEGQEALIQTGHAWWSDYEAAVSVKPFGTGFGMGVAVQDENNFWHVRWRPPSLGVAAAPFELLHRVNGVDTVVKSVLLEGRTANWWRLAIQLQGNRLVVLLDDVELFRHETEDGTGGGILLRTEGKGETYFDDVSVRSLRRLDDPDLLLTAGKPLHGSWSLEEGVLRSKGSDALFQVGWNHWAPQRFTAVCTPEEAISCGLVCGLGEDGRPFWKAGWSARNGGVIEIWNGNHLLEELPWPWTTEKPMKISLDCTTPHHLELWIDDRLALRHATEVDISGACGLFADGRACFHGICAFDTLQRDWEKPVDISRFANDPFMQGWVSTRYAWLTKPDQDKTTFPQLRTFTGDLYGAFALKIPLQDQLDVFFGCDDAELGGGNGYMLRCRLNGVDGSGTISLSRDGQLCQSAEFKNRKPSILPGQEIVDEKIGLRPKTPDTETWGTVELHRDGHAIWVCLDGRELFCHHEPTPAVGRGMAVSLPKPMDMIHLELTREHVKDYLFEQAETDWTSVGRWEVTNRFSCDPRWSHMTGESTGAAALWSKFDLKGDFTIECFAGMRMWQGEFRNAALSGEPRVGDINVAMAADGRELFSGFNLIIQQWDPKWSETWTKLLWKNTLIDQTDQELIPRGRATRPTERAIPVDWDPGGRPVHGAWYALKIRKTDDTFDIYFDNALIFHAKEPEQARQAMGKLALWTQSNSIVLARVKVNYTTMERKAPLAGTNHITSSAATTYNSSTTTSPSMASDISLSLLNYGGYTADFEDGLHGITPWNGDQSAELSRVSRPGGGHCLQARNANSGGDFGFRIPADKWRLDNVERLEFDAMIPEGSHINLYFTTQEAPLVLYSITLSGPDAEFQNFKVLGAFHGLVPGQWSHVSVDLAALLHKHNPWRESWTVSSLMFGMLHEGYLNAGLEGNSAGAVWFMDNLNILPACSIGDAVTGTWNIPNSLNPKEFRTWLSVSPVGEPPNDCPSSQNRTGTFIPESAGLHYVHGEWCDESDTWHRVPPCTISVFSPSAVIRTEPKDNGAWDLGPMKLWFTPNIPCWPRLSGSLKVGGISLPLSPETVEWDETQRCATIAVRLPNAASLLSHGKLECSFQQEGRPPHTWSCTLNPKDDKTPPGPVLVAGTAGSLCGTRSWEDECATDKGKYPYCELQHFLRQDGTPAVKVINAICGSPHSVHFNLPKFDIARFPIMFFDYRLNEGTRIDLQLSMGGWGGIVGLTDFEKSSRYRYLGDLPEFRADGQWHRARVDLQTLLLPQVTDVFRQNLNTQKLAFGNWNYSGAIPGDSYDLSNVMLAKRVSPMHEPLILTWSGMDAGGLRGYSYLWNNQEDTEAEKAIRTTENRLKFAHLQEGLNFFHIRACDMAGNWGPTTHYAFLVDNALPEVERISPANQEQSAPETLDFIFTPESVGRLDLNGALLEFNDLTIPVTRKVAQWTPETRCLRFNLLALPRKGKPLSDGQTFRAKLSGVRNFAGIAMATADTSWSLDYSKDTTPPKAPRATAMTGALGSSPEQTVSWRPLPQYRANTDISNVGKSPEHINVTEFKARSSARPGFGGAKDITTLWKEHRRWMHFSYNLPPDSKINMGLMVNGQWYPVQISETAEPNSVFHVTDFIADGEWHDLAINLETIVAQIQPNEMEKKVQQLSFYCSSTSDAALCIEKLYFMAASPLPITTLSNSDATGIHHHEYKISRSPTTTWEEGTFLTSEQPNLTQLPCADREGLWYVHARSVDGAGNAGAIGTWPFICPDGMGAAPQTGPDGLEVCHAIGGHVAPVTAKSGARIMMRQAQTPKGNQLLAIRYIDFDVAKDKGFQYLVNPKKLMDPPDWKQPFSLDMLTMGKNAGEVRLVIHYKNEKAPVVSEPVAFKGDSPWQKMTFTFQKTPVFPKKQPPVTFGLLFSFNLQMSNQTTFLIDNFRQKALEIRN